MRILFLPLLAGKPWNGNTVLTESLGGSEAAVVYLARAMAKKGHSVSVVTHGTPLMDIGGVVYYHYSRMNEIIQKNQWDVIISSREPRHLNLPFESKNAVKALWFHDMPSGIIEVDAHLLVFISEFQRDAYNVTGSTHRIIGDGVDLTLSDNVANVDLERRNKNKLIWASNPDRGLAIAATIFQQIRKRWPDLELHVYGRSAVYGWGPEVESAYLPRPRDMENVFLHDPLSRANLLRELSKSWAMFYPTFWPETYCMATLEAQAVGTPVITSPIAALKETVKGGILTYDYLNAISQLRNSRRWQKLSAEGIMFAESQSWDLQAERWLSALETVKWQQEK